MLKDGRIVEQGTHAELLAKGGIFADMWADQISSNDEASAHRKSAVVTGFDLEGPPQNGPTDETEDVNGAPKLGTEEVADTLFDNDDSAAPALDDTPAQIAPVSFPSGESADHATVPAEPEHDAVSAEPVPVAFPGSEEAAPVAFPSADDTTPLSFPISESPAPIGFPASLDTASQREGSVAERAIGSPPGVTFQEAATPERTGTPDPEATDGKRRRTLSTQGIQRLARRISITTRRQGSSTSIPGLAGSLIPGLKRENTARSSTDEGSSRDVIVGTDSPSPSVTSEGSKPKGGKIRKEKKDKRKSTS